MRRDHAGAERDAAGLRRDEAAAHRDQAAAQRDQDAAQIEAWEGAGITADALKRAGQGRRDAASDRRRAAKDRRAGARERIEAELDRDTALADRDAAAGSRSKAELDRNTALADRGAGASERSLAELDRDTALADRGAGASERSHAELDRDTALADRGASAREREDSVHDDLTGAYMRGAGFVELKREIARARRAEQPLVLAFVDVDHLKTTNDSQGHAAGDRMLREVAKTFKEKLRSHDLIIRYGGDEFVCAVAGLSTADAAERIGLVNAALAQLPEHGSVTVGLAELQPGDSPEDLVARADAALYRERARQRHSRA
jgi:diguanylate cyclase (GGDEF)-like protein